MERFFNTAGPNMASDSYTLDPLRRFDMDEILSLIRYKARTWDERIWHKACEYRTIMEWGM